MGLSKWLAGIGLACALGAGPALAASNIDCIDSGYSEAENASFQSFFNGFELEKWGQQGPPAELLATISGRAGACADTYGWSPDAIEQSVYYRLGGLLQQALESHSPLTAPQMTRMRAAVAGADQARLRRIFGGVIDAKMAGNEPADPNRSDTIYVGTVIIRSGIPANQTNAEFTGAWMAAKYMRDMAAERFSAH